MKKESNGPDKVIYEYGQDIGNLTQDCQNRRGTFNECGSQCVEGSEGGCGAACVYTCEF